MNDRLARDKGASKTNDSADSHLRSTLLLVTGINLAIIVVVLLYLFQPWKLAGASPPSRAGLSVATPAVTSVPPIAIPAATASRPASANASPTAASTLPPTQIPNTAPSASPPSAAGVLLRVQQAEAGLHSGQIDATMTFTDGTGSTATLRFDQGDANHPPRLYILSTYHGLKETHTIEQISVGNRAWQRESGGAWTPVTYTEGIWAPVQTYLPHVDSAASPQIVSNGGITIVQWSDETNNSDVTLNVDPATGIPQQLRSATHGTGTVLTVVYSGWNGPVDIAPPS